MEKTKIYDNEGGQHPAARPKATARWAKLCSRTIACVSLVTVLFALALLVPHCAEAAGHPSAPPQDLVQAEHIVSEAAHELVRRGETAAIYESDADAVTAPAVSPVAPYSPVYPDSTMSLSAEGSGQSGGVTFPVSTQTIFSVSTPEVTTLTSTTTGTTTVPLSLSESVETECQANTVYVTVTLTAASSALGDATVTGSPGTVTDTDVSYTSGPTDATVSGNPSTLTDVQTEYSVTSGLSDATVSGSPSTVTNVDVSYSHTSSSVSETTKVISDLWSPLSPGPSSTVTAVATSQKTVTTTVGSSLVTKVISDLYPPTTTPSPSPSTTPVEESSAAKGEGASASTETSTSTFTVTETGGPPAVSTTTVEVPPVAPYPSSNGTAGASKPTGTVSAVPGPTTPPVVVSGAAKKPEPRGVGMGNTNLGCTVMLVALVMCVL